MRASSHGGDPRAGVSDRADGGAAVASGGGYKDARAGGVHEGHFGSIEEVGLRAADGVVDDIHAVFDSLVNGGDQVAGVAAGGIANLS